MKRGWGFAIAALALVALWLRVRGLAAEGFADDEVHKWLAALRYLKGDIGGDDVEHPMLMKSLIALCIALLPHGTAPELLTRLPNAVAGAAAVVAVALLARSLYGRGAALVAAALAAVSVTLIGYQRVAKEDTLVGLFMLLTLWALYERRERQAGGFLGAMMASKYYVFLAPLPFVVRRRISWIAAAIVFVALNWTPLLPSTWTYLKAHVAGQHISTPSIYVMGRLYENLPAHVLSGVPFWYYLAFAYAKLTPPVLVAAVIGIGLALWRRSPEDKFMLGWTGFWFLAFSLPGAKYGRYFVPILPAFLLFAALAVTRLRPWIAIVTALLLVGTELSAALQLAPHQRMYVSALAGGEKNLDWLFPHCDYFDAGFREAVQYVNAHAEPGAEISSEIDLPASIYARADLSLTLLRPETACRSQKPCYVILQPGRIYPDNLPARAKLERREPWHIELIRNHPAAAIYRLQPGESPFP